MKTKSGGLLFIGLTGFLFAVNAIVARYSVGHGPPILLGLLRWGGVALVLVAVNWRVLLRYRASVRREWIQIFVLGVLGMTLNGTLPYIGAQTTTATNLSLIAGLSPVMVAVAGRFVLGERASRWQPVGILVAVLGVAVIALRGDLSAAAGLGVSIGDLFVVLASIAWTGYCIMLKLWPSDLPPFARLGLIALGGTAALAPPAVLEWLWLPGWGVDLQFMAAAGVAVLLPGILAFALHAYTTREFGASYASMSIYTVPVFAIAMAVIGLGEELHLFHVTAGVLILVGVWLATLPPKEIA